MLQVAVNYESAGLTARQRAILDFALDVTDMNEISEQDFEELQEHGLSREDAWDIGAVASFFALANRMALLTGVRPDEQLYMAGRTQKKK